MKLFYHQRSSQCHDVILASSQSGSRTNLFGGKRQKNKERKREKGNIHVIIHLTNSLDKSPEIAVLHKLTI